MRKCLLLISLIALLLPGVAFPQNPGTSCGQKEVTDRLFNKNPHLKVFQQQIEKQLQFHAQKVKQGLEQPYQPNAVVTLPVVVHIIHNNGPENISNTQVFTAIQHLNEAFANTGYYDPTDGVNTEIQFCLAQRDPNNNPTNGIDRVVSPLTVMDGWGNGAQDIAVKDLSRWDPRCYINIWLVREITGPVAGYAYLPSAHGMNIDGIVGEAQYFGSSNANDILIIHEMGHYLGLYHTFQGGCTNNDCTKDGDQVCDTPPDQSTAGISCNSTANSCSTDALSGFSTDVNDLHKDYLDYGNWNCMKVFTQGQATRMNWMIQNVRQSLLSCQSCMSPCPSPVTANFSSSGNNITVGTAVNFTNSSVNASGYKWYINNTLQATTTNFSYTFNTIGTYIIKLWALTNNTLCDSAVRIDTVRVTCPVTASFTPGTQTVPINTNINFTNTSTGATTYQWLINGVPQSTALNYPHLFSSGGYYEIKLRASVGLCYDSAMAIITVNDTTPQPPADSCKDYTFQRTLGTNGDDYAFDFMFEYGSYFIAGKTVGQRGDDDGLLMRLNAKGEIMWSKTWGGIDNEQLTHVTKTRDGNFVFVGMSKAPGNPGGKMIFIKTDPSGTELFRRIFNVPFTLTEISGITATSYGGFAICGLSAGALSEELFVANVVNDGLINWARNITMNVSKPGGIVQINDTLVLSVFYDADAFTHLSYLARINIHSGAVIDAKSFSSPNGILEFGEISSYLTNIELTGNVSGAPHFSPFHQFKLELNSDGQLKQAWRLKNADSVIEKNYLMSQDGKIFAQEAAQNPGSLSLIKANSAVNWNSKILTTGSPKFVRIKNMDTEGVSAIGNTDFTATSGQDIYLLKISSTGSAGKCEKTEIPTTLASLGITIAPTFITATPVSTVQETTLFSLQNKLVANQLICLDSASCSIPPVDSCVRSTFQKLYTSQHGLEYSSMNPTSDGGTIHTGLQRTPFPQINALVTKLDKTGNVKWSTAIVPLFASQFHQARETRDGGIIAVGRTTIRGNESSRLLLAKFTASGAIIWLRTYQSSTGYSVGYDVIELSTDHFAIVGYEQVGLNSYGLLLITDQTGNINLSKLYRTQTQTHFNSIVQTADTLTIGGSYNTGNGTNQIGTILNVNVLTGAVIKSVSFQLNNRGSYYNIIYKQPYGYFLSTFMLNNQDWPSKQNGVMRLNHNLQRIDAFQQTEIDDTQWSVSIPLHDTGHVTPTTYNNGFTLMTAGQDNHSIWGNIYGISVGKTEPINPIALDDGYYLGGAKYMLQGKGNFLFVKANQLGKTPDCDGTTPNLSSTAVPANISPLQWNDVSNFINVSDESFFYWTESVPITVTTLCNGCDSIIIPPDTCSSITFQKKIGGDGVDHAFDIKALSNNEYLIAGSTTSIRGTGNSEEALLLKLNNKGNILWQRAIGGFKKEQYTKIVVNAAGEYLVFGKTESQHNTNGSMLLTKFNASGDILWAKEYNFTNASLTGFENVTGAIELTNGDIAFCGNALGINTDVGQPLPATFNIIGVLSNNGTLKWVKRFREYYTESGGAVTGITAMNDALFITSSYGIMKMSVADGTLMGLQKKFQNFGTLNSIEPYGSQLMVYSQIHQLVFDQNLNLVSAQMMLPQEPGYLLSTNGFSSENGAAIQGNYFKMNADYNVFLSRFNGAGNYRWNYRYPYPSSEYRGLSGSRNTIDNGVVSIGTRYRKLSDISNEPADIFILRTDSLGRIPDCPRASFIPGLQSVQGTFIELHARTYPITTQIFDLTLQALHPQLTVQSLCATENCSTLILSAKDTVCSFSDTVTIKAYTDSACDAFTEWIVDTTVARIISQNDSILTLQFKKAGVHSIYARLTGGCRLLQDSVTLTVFNSPDSVNLGPDIQICKISTYTFNAGSGFKSYQWQDGSTDSTLTIYYPGTYHVTAEDYCGNLYRDTVVVSQSPDIPFDLGADLKKCNNDTLTITAPAGFNKYYWSPGYRIDSLYSRVIKVSPDRDTTYTVIAERSPGCLVTDSIRVTVNHSIPIRIGNDTSFCQNDSITITATPGFTNYQWNTGANSQSILVKAAGQYRVSATDSNGCISRDSLDILPLFTLPAVNIGTDLSVCRNTIHEFDAGNFTTYLWQDGSVDRRFRTSQTGTYWVRVSNANGCVNQDTATIVGYLEGPQNFLDSSADICVGQLLEIKAAVGYSRYRWFNNSSSSTINITAPGIYWVEVTNADGCTGRDSISVKAKDCLKGVFFPNAFTPSNGGRNNFFRPIVYGQLESFYLIVFNRYGQKVFETRDAYKGWDGKLNGIIQTTNTFTWSAIYKFSGASEKQQTAKGTVTVIR